MSNPVCDVPPDTSYNENQNDSRIDSLKLGYVNIFSDFEVISEPVSNNTANSSQKNGKDDVELQTQLAENSAKSDEIQNESNSEIVPTSTLNSNSIINTISINEDMSIEDQLQLIQIQQQLLYLQQQELLLRYKCEMENKASNQSNLQTHNEAIPNDISAVNGLDTNSPDDDVWKEAKAPNGRIYYYNKNTKEISWTKPDPLDQTKSPDNSSIDMNKEEKKDQTRQTPSLVQSYSVVNVKSKDTDKTNQPQLVHFNSSPDLNNLINNSFLRIYLPDDQRQVVRFDSDQTLRSVLKKVCLSRPFTEEDYIPKDKDNNELNLDEKMGTIGKDEIYFLTPRGDPKVCNDSKIKKLLAEMLQTNSSLCISLFAILKNYRDPLLENSREPDVKNRIITENQCSLIFTSIDSIAKECKHFKQMLGPIIDKWPVDLEDIFRKHMEIIPYYSNYLNNLRDALNTLEELRKNPDFNLKVDAIQKVNATRLKLEDFIVLPATKICRMYDYVGELCNLVGDTHLNYMTLKEFHLRLSPHNEMATTIYSEYESRKKLLHIQNEVHKIPKKLQLKTRGKFHKEGILGIQTKKNLKIVPVYVFLFTDLLILCKYESKGKQKTYSFFDVINIEQNRTFVEETTSTYGFDLITENPKKGKVTYSFNITSESTSTKLEWIIALKEAIEECNRIN